MAEITLVAETGRPTGSRPANRLRAQGKVPGVVYGLGNDPTPVSVDWRELRRVLTTEAGLNALIDLQVDGDTRLSIVKELQRHPVRHTVDHVDFLLIRRDQVITVDVPVVLEGEAELVTREGGMVDQVLTLLSVSAKPADIPNELPVDISELQIGDTVRIGDLRLPSGVTTDLDPEDPVISAHVATTTLEIEEIDEADAELAAEQAAEAGEGPAAEEAAEGEPAPDEGGGDGRSGEAGDNEA
jgi:large subunit ribosomal protein L25